MLYDSKRLGKDHLAFPAPTDALQAVSGMSPPGEIRADASTLVVPGRGTFFDEHVDLRDPEGTALTATIIEIYDTLRPRKRKRGREALTLRIRKLLANAIRGHFFRQPASILYFRKADSPWYEDKPSWMKHGALGAVVDALAEAGLVQTIKGKKMPYSSDTPSWASSYTPTNALARIAAKSGVFATSVMRRLPSEELVQLFSQKPKPVFDWNKGGLIHARKGDRINFEPTAETRVWTANLKAINAFYRQQNIAVGLSAADSAVWLADRNADPERTGAPYRLPEMFQTDIYRVFNNGEKANPSFDQGGRLFGGWWMSVPSELREAITINGQKTVELDYSECHPRMLYHLAGFDGHGKLYALPEIAVLEAATGVAPDTYRPCVKWLTQVLINGKGRPSAAEKPDNVIIPPGHTIEELVGFIESRHQPIANAFKTGAGMWLMKTESDIALEIVTSAMAEGWAVLSVHDSFISTVDRIDRLKTMMIDVYGQKFGKEPIIN